MPHKKRIIFLQKTQLFYFIKSKKVSIFISNNIIALNLMDKMSDKKITKKEHSNVAMDRVFEFLFPSNQETKHARATSTGLFKEGKKNHEWRDEDNNPIKSCLIHASGFYEVSLDLNRKMHNQRGIAFNLINLGDVWRKLGNNKRALAYWREALTYLSELGDQDNMRLIRQWISEI